MIDVGSKLAGYEIVARLKSGGMATLFLGRRRGAAGFSRHVAIKVVHPHLASDVGFVRMFVDEALLSARIQHPNVVHVEELGEADGTHFLVMEYVHGCALSDLLRALSRLERRMAPELAAWIAMQVLEGLHAAHELKGSDGELLDVIHRDVSPQNVLISAHGAVKLIDFGIAKARGRSHRTATGSLRGKIRYMPPEQAYGKPLDRRTDVYALGVVLWEMLTMRRMFDGDNELALLDEVRNPKHDPPSRYAKDVPPALDAVVLRGLAPNRDDRPTTALDFRREIAKAVPRASALDGTHLANVIDAILGQEIEIRRRSLPDSLTRDNVPTGHDATKESKRPRVRDEIITEMTHSAPGTKYVADEAESAFESTPPPPIEAVPPNGAAESPPSLRGAMTPTPVITIGTSASTRERRITIAAIAVAVFAVVTAASVLAFSNRSSGENDDESAREVPVGIAPVTPLPASPDAVPDAGPREAAPSDIAPRNDVAQNTVPERARMSRMTSAMQAMTGDEPEMSMSVAEGAYIVEDDEF